MIKSISITNFKGIKDSVTIDFKPITLLFGPNSAGKSTIMQSLLLFYEILTYQDCDVHKSSIAPTVLDLGGYDNYVYNKDKSLSTNLRIGFNLPEDGLIEYEHRDLQSPDEYYKQYQKIGNSISNACLELSIAWSVELGRPIIQSYTIYDGEELLTSIKYNTKESYIFLVNIDNSSIVKLYDKEELAKIKDYLTIKEEYNNLVLSGSYLTYIRQDDGLSVLINRGIPFWGYPLYQLDYFNDGPDLVSDGLLNMLADLTVSFGEILVNNLKNLIHIGPIREIPERIFEPYRSQSFERWVSGIASWDAIANGWVNIERVNYWLHKVGINYRIDKTDVYELSPQNIESIMSKNKGNLFNKISDVFDNYIGEQAIYAQSFNEAIASIFKIFNEYDDSLLKTIKEFSLRQKIGLVDEDKNITLSPHDVGVGISQVFPVIVASLLGWRTFLSVEQPELHIHPAMQVELADLFIEQINIHESKTFFIETHSEHLILRLLRRIEENSIVVNQQIANQDSGYKMDHNKLSVYWCNNMPDGQEITPLPIDETGEFTRKWPKGFFEERAEELFAND